MQLPKPVMAPFSAGEWTEQLKLLVSEQLAEQDTTIEITISYNAKTITADKNLINQVVLNLIYNAADALKERNDNRRIGMQIQNKGNSQILINVSNNGPQIPPENLEKIFIPFFTTKKEGSGIGLALSRQILYLHKGLLWVNSSPDETVFSLEIPA